MSKVNLVKLSRTDSEDERRANATEELTGEELELVAGGGGVLSTVQTPNGVFD